jgi:hypothetical protein
VKHAVTPLLIQFLPPQPTFVFGKLMSYCRTAKYLVPIIVWTATWSYATTVVIFVTPYGIVVGTDSKGTVASNVCRPDSPDEVRDRKAIYIGKNLLIAHVGLAQRFHILWPSGLVEQYRFENLVAAISKKITSKVSVTQLTRIAEAESTGPMIEILSDMMVSGGLPLGMSNVQQFLIAGYESGMPLIYSVNFEIGRKHIGVARFTVIEQPRKKDAWGDLKTYGSDRALREIGLPNSKAHQYAFSRAPVEMDLLIKGQPLSLEQAQTVVKTAIETEIELDPQVVGPPPRLFIVTKP